MDTEAGAFSLPDAEIDRAIEFLASPDFGPGITRIPMRKLQDLREKVEHWAMYSMAIRLELIVVDVMLVTYQSEVAPKGPESEAKRCYLEFCETIEAVGVNSLAPDAWGFRTPPRF